MGMTSIELNGNRKQEGPNMGIRKHEGETRAWRAHGEQNNNGLLGNTTIILIPKFPSWKGYKL